MDSIIGQPILFSGKVIEVYDDGRVQIGEGKRLFTVCILHGIPRDLALAITKDDYLEGEGTVRDIDTTLGLSVHITANTLNGETITSPQEPQPTSEEPGATPGTTPAVGTSRSNPYPAGEIAPAPNWDVQVREIVRGDAAWQAIQTANMFNDPPSEGMEYLLVKLWVKSKHGDDETHSITGSDFQVTGDHLVRYGSAGVVEPDPQLDAELYAGGEAEGWVAFSAAEGEGNLILIIAELFSFDEDTFRFLALDEGAAIEVDYDLDLITPTAVGRSRSNPAPLGETVTSEDWQITVLEVVRGTEAWTMVQEANQFNDAPTEGMEYVVVRMRVRYIGTADETVSVDSNDLKSTGSVGRHTIHRGL